MSKYLLPERTPLKGHTSTPGFQRAGRSDGRLEDGTSSRYVRCSDDVKITRSAEGRGGRTGTHITLMPSLEGF